MNYRFTDGRLVTPEARPPATNEDRIAGLEQRVADLEAAIIMISQSRKAEAKTDPLEHLK
jgi:hypothetical protein